MAQINISGTVTCKQGENPVTLKTLGESYQIAEFSVRDSEYFYFKGDKEDKPGQFYKVQVGGKSAEYIAEKLERGDFVAVTGQLVQRVYNDKIYLDVKDARVNQPYKERSSGGGGGDSLF